MRREDHATVASIGEEAMTRPITAAAIFGAVCGLIAAVLALPGVR